MFIFDACTIINILHIDEDDFLNRKLDKFDFSLTKCVSDEVHKHVYDKFARTSMPNRAEEKRIEIKINYFRLKIFYPENYLEYADSIEEKTAYKKRNCEFYSVVLSSFMKEYERKTVVFYTDDYPAKLYFTPFFNEKEIGRIDDLVDLLDFLHDNSDDFTFTDKKKYLSSLFYEVASAIVGLQKDIEGFEIPKFLIKDKEFRSILDSVRRYLAILDIDGLNSSYYFLCDKKRFYPQLYSIFKKYKDFFDQNISTEYLLKIKRRVR